MHLHYILTALIWVVVSYVIFMLVSSLLLSRRNARRARELNCEDPPLQRNRYPLGIDNLLRAIKADKAKLFPVDMIQRTVDNGAITYEYSLMGGKFFFTADEMNIQALLATQFSDFGLGPNRRGNFWPLLGNGIFTQDGKAWEHSRAMMRPQFAREQISDLGLEERHVQHMMQALDSIKNQDGWTSCDLQVLFFRLTLDSATEFLFGQSVDSQLTLIPGREQLSGKDGDINSLGFAEAFDDAQQTMALRARFGDKYWAVNPKGFKESCKVCHDFIDHFVRLALTKHVSGTVSFEKEPESGGNGKKQKYIFLEALATMTQDPIELRSQLLHILLAGRDTTASLLGWVFLCLSKDPTRYQKLREIIVDEFGGYENPKEITFAKLKACRYLQHCINEALRLYPIVPLNSRFANCDTTLPTGGGKDGKSKIFVPKGTSCDYSVHVMHHRKDIWGEDAEDFNPERWEGRKVGWEFLPFNGGPRICIGQSFAIIEASYVTVRLIQRYDQMVNLDTSHITTHNMTITNCSGNGVKVLVHTAT